MGRWGAAKEMEEEEVKPRPKSELPFFLSRCRNIIGFFCFPLFLPAPPPELIKPNWYTLLHSSSPHPTPQSRKNPQGLATGGGGLAARRESPAELTSLSSSLAGIWPAGDKHLVEDVTRH